MNEQQTSHDDRTTIRQEVSDARGNIVGRAEAEFPNTRLGNVARVYSVLGVIGFVMVGCATAFGFVIKSSLDTSEANQIYMQQQLNRIWDEGAKERKDMVDRYIASREGNDKKHAELLVRLDKIVIYIELAAGKLTEKIGTMREGR